MVAKVISLYGGRDPRDLPAYAIGEAAVYLGVPPSTLRTWVRGQRVRGRTLMRPLIKAADPDSGTLSFTNVAEAYVLASLTRKFALPLRRVRNALGYVGGERPLLATVFHTDGVGIFVEKMGALVDAARGGQAAIRNVVESSLQRVELDEHRLPLRLYPWRRQPDEPRVIALDPRRSFGRPTVVGRGVQMGVVVDRHLAGDSVSRLATDYEVSADVIEDVLRWGMEVARAA
jgi:uncharacterized protein (DUF433 family)/transposase-like protein